MKKMLRTIGRTVRAALALATGAMMCMPDAAFARDYAGAGRVEMLVPGAYAFIVVEDVRPEETLDGEKVVPWLRERQKTLGTPTVDIAFYEQGKKRGDGLRAMGVIGKTGKIRVMEFSTEAEGKSMEKMLGIPLYASELYQHYATDARKAHTLLTGKPILLNVVPPQGLSRCAGDVPCIRVRPRGTSGAVRILLHKGDALLPAVRNGCRALVSGTVREFKDGEVVFQGELAHVDQPEER